jgi:hypothetical protein
MSDHTTETDEAAAAHEARMLRAVVRDITVALPLALLAVFGAIVIFTDKSIGDAAVTAVLPGVLIGVFFGGFSGTARTMN